jgi:hypothetical protein
MDAFASSIARVVDPIVRSSSWDAAAWADAAMFCISVVKF